ncbi:MAG: hypothetical protein FJY92_00530 [Candidatus Hydrogenedentes bacterium]|nr:hypothetical protein [Candidatus Hydrogenedentota bacterium]
MSTVVPLQWRHKRNFISLAVAAIVVFLLGAFADRVMQEGVGSNQVRFSGGTIRKLNSSIAEVYELQGSADGRGTNYLTIMGTLGPVEFRLNTQSAEDGPTKAQKISITVTLKNSKEIFTGVDMASNGNMDRLVLVTRRIGDNASLAKYSDLNGDGTFDFLCAGGGERSYLIDADRMPAVVSISDENGTSKYAVHDNDGDRSMCFINGGWQEVR